MLTKVSMWFVNYISIFSLAFVLLIACSKPVLDSRIHSYNNVDLPRVSIGYQASAEWQKVQPKNSMRVEEFAIGKDSSLSVYRLPGNAGTVAENKTRWEKQFKDNDKRKVLLEEQFNIGVLPITKFYLTGDYLEAENPFIADTKRITHEDWSMFVAVVELADEKWFFKAVGPSAEIKAEQGKLNDFVLSIRAKS